MTSSAPKNLTYGPRMTMDWDPYYKARFLGVEEILHCFADASHCQQLEERDKVGGRRAAT